MSSDDPSDGKPAECGKVVVYDKLPRRADEITLTCIECKTPFKRKIRYEKSNRRQGKRGPFCGHACAGVWQARLR